MFRRPTEIDSDSSSSASSASDDEKNDEHVSRDNSEDIVEFGTSNNTLSLSINDEISQETPETPSDTSYHGHMIIATLLEELARTRAAELLSSTTSGPSYSRFSPDVQPVAQRMFTEASRMLSSNGVLPITFASNDRQSERKKYLEALERVGRQALQEPNTKSTTVDEMLLLPSSELAIAKIGSLTSDNTTLIAPSLEGLNFQGSSFMAFPSPHIGMQLSRTASPAPRSRFRSEFQQIKVLGRGGFGQVHHCVNFVDNQHYAIKRIPLSSKMSRRWQEKGMEDSENILREIRTLARLEHVNVVRYFNAWIETPYTSVTPATAPVSSLAASGPTMRMIEDRPTAKPRPGIRSRSPPIGLGEGISFGEGSISQQSPSDAEIVNLTSVEGDSTSTIPLRDSEIFADGRSQASSARQSPEELDSVYVLHLQMSIHTMTLATYLSPPSPDQQQSSRSATKRHCFHIVPSLRLLLGILCGLQYLHTMHIVHRDIKPGNILLSDHSSPNAIAPPGFHDVSCSSCTNRTGYWLNPRIADFGLVADVRRSSLASTPSRAKIVGTEFYRPPDKGKGRGPTNDEIDESLDVFALGVVLFEMLWPFSTKMERFLLLTDLSQHGRLPTNFSAKLDGHVPGAGDAITACVAGMVERDSTHRWSCDRVKRSVEDILVQCQYLSHSLKGSKAEVSKKRNNI